jgi:hypothetical protein
MAKLPTATFPGGKSKFTETVIDSVHDLKQGSVQDLKQERVESVSKDGNECAIVKSENGHNIESAAVLEDGREVKVEFTCEMCSETFTNRSDLLIHVPIHI